MVSISHNRSCLESNDGYFILNRQSFLKYVNVDDFECRKSKKITPAYHQNWFENENNFLPPIMYFKDGKISFINGRHRTALLYNYLNEIPVIFLSASASYFSSPTEINHNQKLMDQVLNPIDLNTYFNFPNLPIINFS